MLLQWHLNSHQHIEARAHALRPNHTRRRLASCQGISLLRERLGLGASHLMHRPLGLKPMAVHLSGGIDVMMEELAPRRAVYLEGDALRGRQQHEVPRVSVAPRLVLRGGGVRNTHERENRRSAAITRGKEPQG